MSLVVRNALSLVASQVATLAIALVSLIVVPRYLGENEFGKFAFAGAYVGLFGLIGLFGTNIYLTKAVARDHSQVGTYVFNTLVMKLSMGSVLALSSIGLGIALGFDDTLVALVTAAAAAMLIVLLNDTVTGALNGMERMARPAFWFVVQQYVAATLGLGVILLDGGVVAYAWVLVPAAAIPLIMNLLSLRTELHRQRIDWTVWRLVLLGGLPFLAIAAVRFVYGSVDILMLRWLTDEPTVGWYALAYRWIGLPVVLAFTALRALFPTLAQQGITVSQRFLDVANRAIRFVVFVTFPLAVGVWLVAGDVFALFYPSGEFDRSIVLMRILTLSIPIVVIDMVLGLVLLASDRQRQWLLVGVTAALLNPALNIFAIPFTADRFGNGAIGAATATLLTEIAMMVGALYFRPRGVLDGPTVRFVMRVTIASGVIALALWPLWSLGLLPKIIVGGAVYVAASVVFRTVKDSGVMSLVNQLGGSLRRRRLGEGNDV